MSERALGPKTPRSLAAWKSSLKQVAAHQKQEELQHSYRLQHVSWQWFQSIEEAITVTNCEKHLSGMLDHVHTPPLCLQVE